MYTQYNKKKCPSCYLSSNIDLTQWLRLMIVPMSELVFWCWLGSVVRADDCARFVVWSCVQVLIKYCCSDVEVFEM